MNHTNWSFWRRLKEPLTSNLPKITQHLGRKNWLSNVGRICVGCWLGDNSHLDNFPQDNFQISNPKQIPRAILTKDNRLPNCFRPAMMIFFFFFDFYCITSQNGYTHFKILAGFATSVSCVVWLKIEAITLDF